MPGPESRFIHSVHEKLPKEVYREKMHNVYRGGTFDVWYSGKARDLWIEYKWVGSIPKKGTIVPDLSMLQLKWGRGRQGEGRNVFVVVGCPDGGVLLKSTQWEEGVSVEEFRKALLTKSALAKWIHEYASVETLNAPVAEAVHNLGSHGVDL